ncbi:MAG: hypothetical protein ACKO24_01885 [Leptolyngbyaceae cyanobacterium]
MNTSLGQFSKDYNLAKTTVYNVCQRLNISTSEGLDPDAVATLKAEFKLDRPEPQAEPEPEPEPEPEAQAVDAELVPENFWQTSELVPVDHHEITLPDTFDPAAMVRFFDGVTGSTTDTQQLVEIAKIAIDAANSAMDQKVDAQREAFNQAQKDAKRLETMVSEAQTNMKIKALESKMIAEHQTKLTTDAEAIFAQLMGLGKPTDG